MNQADHKHKHLIEENTEVSLEKVNTSKAKNVSQQSDKEFEHRYRHLADEYISVLGDHEEFKPINPVKEFSFSMYADAIIKMIKGSDQKFSVGIYGEWGTGKTTLMKLIEA